MSKIQSVGQFKVVEDILSERELQDERWGEQNHPDISVTVKVAETCLSLERIANKIAVQRGTLTWRSILAEEVAEAYLEAAKKDSTALRAELVQVAAVAVAWIEAIDRRERKETDERARI